jgi:benzoyl-CoA reductase/2-hydroxyglutaryl-CoA dehydratase subunit BcrC/BadD/HgdB
MLYSGFFNLYFRPKRSALQTLLVPSELLAAFNISPLLIESLGGILGSLGMTDRFLNAASRAGIPESLCTFHKMHLAFSQEGGFSKPEFAIAASALCDGNLPSIKHLAVSMDTSFHFLDFPEPGSTGAVEYLAGQLEETFYSIADRLGFNNPVPRLQKAVEKAEEARGWMIKLNEIRKNLHIPGINNLIWGITVYSGFTGSDYAVRYYRSLYRTLERKGKPIPRDAKGILLMHLLPVYTHPAFELMYKKNVVITMEEFSYVPWPELDPARPFESIARRALSWHFMGKPEERVRCINTLIDEYSIDGVLFTSHWGCRQSAGPIHAIAHHIKKPLLRVETDLVDSNSAASGQLITRIEGFLEMIENT